MSRIVLGDQQYYTIPQAAKIIGVSRQRMHVLIKTHGMRTILVNARCRLIPCEEVDRLPSCRPTGTNLKFRSASAE